MKKRYISEPMPYTEDIRFLYRWDSRPPEAINKSGFQGGAVNVYFNMSFGVRTVFCSASLKGAEYYFQELENGMSLYGGTYYLYKIYSLGLPAVKVYQYKNNAGFVKQFSTRFSGVDNKLMDKEHAMSSFALLSRFNNYIDKVAVYNEEVQLPGPILPCRITFLFSHKLSQETIKIRDNEKNDLLLKQADFKNRLIKRRTSWRCV